MKNFLMYVIFGDLALLGYEITVNPEVSNYSELTRLGKFATIVFLLLVLVALVIFMINVVKWFRQLLQ